LFSCLAEVQETKPNFGWRQKVSDEDASKVAPGGSLQGWAQDALPNPFVATKLQHQATNS
jgi:hypothetical protein